MMQACYFVTICTHQRHCILSRISVGDKRSALSKVVGDLKMNSSKQIHAIAPNLVVWQRSFHEHVIRNEQDYLEIWNYIDGNPSKWAEDRYCST